MKDELDPEIMDIAYKRDYSRKNSQTSMSSGNPQ